MHISRIAVLLIAAALTACASAPLVPLARPSAEQQAEVVVYRESSLAAAFVSLTVGVNGKAIVRMENNEKVRVLLPAGEHEVFVQARSANPTTVKVQLAPGASVCLRTSASPSTLVKAVVPLVLMATGYHFYLDPMACPSRTELEKYRQIPVAYQ